MHVAYRAVLLAAGLVVAGAAFRQLITLVLALVIIVILALPLSALASKLERRGVPRPIGALAGIVLGLIVLAGLAELIVPPLVHETQRFIDAVPSIVDNARERIRELIGARPGVVGKHAQQYLQDLLKDPGRIVGPAVAIGVGIAGVIGALVVIVLTAYYMAVQPGPLVNGALRLFPPRHRTLVRETMLEIRDAWLGWLRGVLIDMAVTGVLLYLGLWIVGLDFRLVFSVFAALLVVVPYFGAIAGAIPPVLFALTLSPGRALAVLAVYVLVQQIEGNVVIPLVMARVVRLHPAVIAIGVVVVGQLFGLLGLMISVPLISAAVILVRRLWVNRIESDPRPAAAAVATHTGWQSRTG
jgi:predicted PurR-regulated permease PerM